MAEVIIETTESGIAITGQSTGSKGIGVKGEGAAVGVRGDGKSWHGVAGLSESTTGGYGVYGKNTAGGTGVAGESDTWVGVYGKSDSSTGGAGVRGDGGPGPGVIGKSKEWIGVYGETESEDPKKEPAGVWGEHKGKGVGVKAKSKDGVGLVANSETNVAVHAETKSPANAAIAAYNLNPAGLGAAIYAKKMGNVGHAGFFEGNVFIKGSLSVQGVDVASLLQRIIQLEEIVSTLLKNSGGKGSGSNSKTTATLTLDVTVTQSEVKMTGQGFRPSVECFILVDYPDLRRIVLEDTADSNGELNFNIAVSKLCIAGATLTLNFTVNQPDASGRDRLTNTVSKSISC